MPFFWSDCLVCHLDVDVTLAQLVSQVFLLCLCLIDYSKSQAHVNHVLMVSPWIRMRAVMLQVAQL